jgi:prepilin-type N-terminal cleavage/methylation domain-containing protein
VTTIQPPSGGSRGFTLLEVLISIMILVLAIAAIVPLFAVGSASHRRGIDQANVAWIAPRIAAKIQERLTEMNPRDIQGYVKELEDGSLLIDDAGGKVAPDPAATYSYKAKFTPITSIGSQSDPMPSTCFLLRVEISFRDNEQIIETYDTVVLRKLLR